jgi:hypothetical protein
MPPTVGKHCRAADLFGPSSSRPYRDVWYPRQVTELAAEVKASGTYGYAPGRTPPEDLGPLAELSAERRGHLGFYQPGGHRTPRWRPTRAGAAQPAACLLAGQRSSWTCRPARPPFLALRERTDDDFDRQDIRLAVVLNGGVSLAIWTSGVTPEAHQLAISRRWDKDNPPPTAGPAVGRRAGGRDRHVGRRTERRLVTPSHLPNS